MEKITLTPCDDGAIWVTSDEDPIGTELSFDDKTDDRTKMLLALSDFLGTEPPRSQSQSHREENIVNIAMKAAELLMTGKMERDDLTGHAGLTDHIIILARQFEDASAQTDWNAPEAPDYWEAIDSFAEQQLLEHYAMEPPENPVKLWARVGVTLDVPQEAYEQLQRNNSTVLMDILQGRVGQIRLDGETYFPYIEQNAGLEDMSFSLPPPGVRSVPDPHISNKRKSNSLDRMISDAQARKEPGKDIDNGEDRGPKSR